MNCGENKRLVWRLLEVVNNQRRLERIPEFIGPDLRDRVGGIRSVRGLREHVKTFFHCYPDMRIHIQGQGAERGWVVTWFEAASKHRSQCHGIQPTGKRRRLKGVRIDRLRKGRFLEHWGVASTLEALLEMALGQYWDETLRASERAALYRLTTPPKNSERSAAVAPDRTVLTHDQT